MTNPKTLFNQDRQTKICSQRRFQIQVSIIRRLIILTYIYEGHREKISRT